MADSAFLPLPFYLCLIAAFVTAKQAWEGRNKGWGIPMLAVIFSACVWYPGDAIYNNYTEYVSLLGEAPLVDAWWQVLLFFVSFGLFVPNINHRINGKLERSESHVIGMIKDNTINRDDFQKQISSIAALLLIPWILLMIVALARTQFDFMGLFFPYLGLKADPWNRTRLGGGIDSLLALAGYLQIMLTALFGICFALSKRIHIQILTGAVYFLAVPFYVFDRTRNSMLAVLIPGFMAFVTFRIHRSLTIKLVVMFFGLFLLQGWMKFVIENRDKASIVEAYQHGGTQDIEVKSQKHLGLNMLEELGFINYFIANGTYNVNWGKRYFAELVNPIPRVIWKNKPLIGIDYAIARGMAYGNQDAANGGVAASISTGMIGQGVVNFGRFLGPVAAALLMALWVAILARQDLMSHDIAHLLLYAIGLVLTFNMGRDITLLVIYPFIFGWALLKIFDSGREKFHIHAT